METIIITPDITSDYVNITYGEDAIRGENIPVYMPRSNAIIFRSNFNNAMVTVTADISLKLKANILCSLAVSKEIRSIAPSIPVSVLLPENEFTGFMYMDNFEEQKMPKISDLDLPLLKLLSQKGSYLYQIRPDIVAAIFNNRNDYDMLEHYHVFIQILFPTQHISKQVPFMANFVITPSDYKIFRNNPQFLKDTVKSVEAMFTHWGIGVNNDKITITDTKTYRSTIGAKSDHNQARFTRTIQCLKEVLPDMYDLLKIFIDTTIMTDTKINSNSKAIWMNL